MFTFVLLVSLSAQPAQGALDLEAVTQHAVDDAAGLEGDEWATGRPPANITVGDDARVKRFVGALAGGIVGAGLAMALLPLGDAGGGGCTFCSTITPLHGFLGALAPLLAMTGAFTGWQLMGGDGAFASTAASMLPAGLLLSLLFLVVPSDQSTVWKAMPELLTGLVMVSALSAVVLDVRERQLDALGSRRTQGSAPGVRVAAEVGMNLLGVATTTAMVLIVSTSTSFNGSLAIGLGVTLATLGLVGTTLATWGVHRGLHGHGSFASSILGFLLGAAVGGGTALIAALGASTHVSSASDFSFMEVMLAVEAPAVAMLVASSLALEWSHTAAIGESTGPSLQLGGGPVAGGAMVSAGLRF
jgi:hypothetical protein